MFAAIAVASVWFGDQLVLSPLVASWKERTARIAELRKTVNNGTLTLARASIIRDRWEGMRTNTLPSEMSVAESRVLKAFDRWSQESRISITSIKPQWKHNADDFMTLECRVDASGSLSTVSRFLYEIEKDPIALKVDALELAAKDTDGQQLTLGLQVSGLLLNPADQ
ncbi:MAG TPA: hypothetical protein DCM86_03515 [Verrucomicrobiales bacterium]|nr:hypothetical protein [Verrucomicrobiales bacterium]